MGGHGAKLSPWFRARTSCECRHDYAQAPGHRPDRPRRHSRRNL